MSLKDVCRHFGLDSRAVRGREAFSRFPGTPEFARRRTSLLSRVVGLLIRRRRLRRRVRLRHA